MDLDKKMVQLKMRKERAAVIETWRDRLVKLRDRGMHTKRLCIKHDLSQTYICHMMAGRFPASSRMFDKVELAIRIEEEIEFNR